jgi:hypothetical protein
MEMSFEPKGCVQRIEEMGHITYEGLLGVMGSFYEEEGEMGARLREGSIGDREIQKFIVRHGQVERSLEYIKHAFSKETYPSVEDKCDMAMLIDHQLETISLSREGWKNRLKKKCNPRFRTLLDA